MIASPRAFCILISLALPHASSSLSLIIPCSHRRSSYSSSRVSHQKNSHPPKSIQTSLQLSNDINEDDDEIDQLANDIGIEIVRGGGGEISEETWRDIQEGAPSKFEAMKSILGINIFTYILAILIAFFLSMNSIYGPGWFGQWLGWENVGTFTRVSDSLPMDVDVSGKEFLF